MTPVHLACLEFAISLLNQKVLRTEYDCALTCAMAVLGVQSDGRWKATDTYSPVLSEVVKIARFMVVHKGTDIATERYYHLGYKFGFMLDVGRIRLILEMLKRLDRRQQDTPDGQVGCPEMVGRLMDRFMVRGTNGPMQRILHMRGRCMQYNKKRTTEGRIDWAGDRVLYKDIGFEMAQLRGMVRDLIRQTRQILIEDLLLLGQTAAAGDGNGKATGQ
jgi:hypothetical protein